MYSLTQLKEFEKTLVLDKIWDVGYTWKFKHNATDNECFAAERILRRELADKIYGQSLRKKHNKNLEVLIEMNSVMVPRKHRKSRIHSHGKLKIPTKFKFDNRHLSEKEIEKRFQILVSLLAMKNTHTFEFTPNDCGFELGWRNYMNLNRSRDGATISQV